MTHGTSHDGTSPLRERINSGPGVEKRMAILTAMIEVLSARLGMEGEEFDSLNTHMRVAVMGEQDEWDQHQECFCEITANAIEIRAGRIIGYFRRKHDNDDDEWTGIDNLLRGIAKEERGKR